MFFPVIFQYKIKLISFRFENNAWKQNIHTIQFEDFKFFYNICLALSRSSRFIVS